jgi:hypothetical protein
MLYHCLLCTGSCYVRISKRVAHSTYQAIPAWLARGDCLILCRSQKTDCTEHLTNDTGDTDLLYIEYSLHLEIAIAIGNVSRTSLVSIKNLSRRHCPVGVRSRPYSAGITLAFEMYTDMSEHGGHTLSAGWSLLTESGNIY